MPQYYDSKGKSHVLAKEIGRGGEGTVYFCAGNDELVAKIYHEPISDNKAQKLQLMATNKNERLLKVAAWVVETLHDKPHGKVIGFLMPRIKAKEIHELYSLKSRRRHFPQATWHYLIHTSTNLARAFYSLHKYEHVIGDVNHGNCVVLADGTVKLIDCDSYAISDGEKRFACEVGVATHLAPELQKSNLSEVERKPEHDNFSLAIVIFQLLFLGRHPFAGNYIGEKDKTLEDCIREFRFPYGKNAQKYKVRQPPGTLFLDEVSPRVTDLFERAFDEKSDNRPTPREWIKALVDMSENLSQCVINPGHRFFNGLTSCPWCRIESQTGLMLFPFVFNEEQADGEAQFNIFTVEKLIENLGKKRNLPAKLKTSHSLTIPEPALEIVESAKLNRNHQFLFVGGYFLGLVFLTIVFGIVVGTILGILLMFYLFTTLSNDNKELQKSLMSELKMNEKKLKALEKEYSLSGSPKMFAGDINEIKRKIKNYKELQIHTRRDLKKLESEHKHKKFTDYLRKHRVAETDIAGISDKSRDDLVKKRVWTAAEIDPKLLKNNYKVNDWVTKHLLNWRAELEKNFVYQPDSATLKKQKSKFLERQKKETLFIEREIEKSLEEMRKNSIEAEKNQKLIIPKSEKLVKQISQNQSNLNAVGDTSIALASLILVTVLVPFVGGIVSEMSSSKNEMSVDSPYNNTRNTDYESIYDEKQPTSNIEEVTKNTDIFPYIGEVLSTKEANNLEILNQSLTETELEVIPDHRRKYYSDNLVRQAIHLVNKPLVSRNVTMQLAKTKLERAMQIKNDNVSAYEHFGVVLYNNKFYEESISHFLELEKTVGATDRSKTYLGNSYLMIEKYAEAEKVFKELSDTNLSADVFFNLGLAYKGSKKYQLAVGAFEVASSQNPTDVDTNYELGFAYFKLNKKEKFNEQYAKLVDLNPTKAKQLLNESYKLPPSKIDLKKATEKVVRTYIPVKKAPPPPPKTLQLTDKN